MESRREQKEKCLAEKQAAETAEQLALQQQERDALRNKHAKDVENTTLKEAVKVYQ